MRKTNMALSADFLQILNEDNYADWSVQVRDHLMAHDLWDIVETTPEPHNQEDDYIVFHAWSKKNSKALHVIKNSCEPNTLFEILEIRSAKVAWNTLEKKYLSTSSGLSLLLSLPLSLSLSLMHMHAQTKTALNMQMFFKLLRKIIIRIGVFK
jgi:hypothetical protein